MTMIAEPLRVTIVWEKIRQAIEATDQDGGRKWRIIILEGSSRSSKTTSTIQCYYDYAYEWPNKRMSVWRETAKDCRDTVGHDMAGTFPNMPGYSDVRFHSTKSIYTFPTASTIEITGTDDIDKVHGFQGDVIWLNEPYRISRETFNQLSMRTADFIIIDWNPKENHWIDDLKKDPRTLVIHSTFRDNPMCPVEQRRQILSYQTVAQSAAVVGKLLTEANAFRYDLSGNPAGLTEKLLKELIRCRLNHDKRTANAFSWSVYGLGVKGERPNRIFRWDEISDEEYKALPYKIYYGCDWGVVDPWAIIEAKYHDGCLYLHERNYASENEITSGMSSSEIAAIKGADEGLVNWVFTKLGIDKSADVICDTNRPTKIAALRRSGWSRSQPAVKIAGSIIDGISILNGLRVYYTRSSTNLAYEQENYSREVDRYGVVLEEPMDCDNHCMDSSRYISMHLHRIGIIRKV